MRTLLWVLAGLGAMAGGALLVLGLLFSRGAPQEAAVAGIACAAAVLPYVLARSWDELARQPAAGARPEPVRLRPLRARDRSRMLWAATATVVLGLALLGLLAGADTASGNSALMRQLNDAATVVGTAFALALLLTVVLAVVAHRRA